MALTTTTGLFPTRSLTIEAVRSIALASSTEVPPNFMTIIAHSLAGSYRGQQAKTSIARSELLVPIRGRKTGEARTHSRGRWPSPEISLRLQQLCIEQGRSGRAANRIMRKHGEFPIQHLAGTQTAHRGGHARPTLRVKTRLWTIAGFQVDYRLRRSAR